MKEKVFLHIFLLALGVWLCITPFFMGGLGTIILLSNEITGGLMILAVVRIILSERDKEM